MPLYGKGSTYIASAKARQAGTLKQPHKPGRHYCIECGEWKLEAEMSASKNNRKYCKACRCAAARKTTRLTGEI